MSQITLYNYFRSSTSYRVRIALNLKNLPYDYKPIHLLKNGGEQHSHQYKELNPIGGVPTLVHELNEKKLIVSQSLAILQYLDEVFSDGHSLFPKDSFLKAKVLQFCENINADTHPYGNLKTLQYLQSKFNITEEQKLEWIQHWVHQGLTACEKMINQNNGPFCFGDEITAADILLIPQLFTAKRFQVSLDAFPKLNQVNENCLHVDAFKKAHPSQQPDFEG